MYIMIIDVRIRFSFIGVVVIDDSERFNIFVWNLIVFFCKCYINIMIF